MTLWFSNPLPPWPSERFTLEVFEAMQNIHELGARISQLFSGVHPLIHTEFLLFASNWCQDEKNTPHVKVCAKKLKIYALLLKKETKLVVLHYVPSTILRHAIACINACMHMATLQVIQLPVSASKSGHEIPTGSLVKWFADLSSCSSGSLVVLFDATDGSGYVDGKRVR